MKPERSQLWWDGVAGGLVGYATVAIVIAAVNVVFGRSPFHTAALLGQAMFYGLADPAQLRIWPGPVLAYNGFHLVVFLVLGLAAAWFAQLAERGPQFWYIGAVMMLFVAFHLFGVFLFVTDPIRAALSPWMLLGAGFAAMIAMSMYLAGTHPRLRAEFRDFATFDADLVDREG
jgi:hypothetical protein